MFDPLSQRTYPKKACLPSFITSSCILLLSLFTGRLCSTPTEPSQYPSIQAMEAAAEPPNLKRTSASEAWTLKPCKPPAKPKTNLQLRGASDIPYPEPKLIRAKGLSFTVRSEIKKDTIYSGFLGTRERTMVVKLYRPKDCLEDFDKVAIAIRALCAEHEAYEKMRHVAYAPNFYGLF
jgi:hypothetical protein